MIEPQISTEFSAVERQHLAALIGSKFLFLGGKDLPEYLMASQLVISTSNGDLCFEGDVVESEIEGYVENYSKIKVSAPTKKEISNLQSRGHVYFKHAGEVIIAVYIVRRVITELKHGVPSWSIATSRAVVIDFGSTQLCVSKLGEHDEALAVTEMDGFDIDKLPETSSYFEIDLETGYQVQEDLIRLSLPDA
jgi:hypothetical protein